MHKEKELQYKAMKRSVLLMEEMDEDTRKRLKEEERRAADRENELTRLKKRQDTISKDLDRITNFIDGKPVYDYVRKRKRAQVNDGKMEGGSPADPLADEEDVLAEKMTEFVH